MRYRWPTRIYECQDLNYAFHEAATATVAGTPLHVARVTYAGMGRIPTVCVRLVGPSSHHGAVTDRLRAAMRPIWTTYCQDHAYAAQPLAIDIRYQQSAIVARGVSSAGAVTSRVVMGIDGTVRIVGAGKVREGDHHD